MYIYRCAHICVYTYAYVNICIYKNIYIHTCIPYITLMCNRASMLACRACMPNVYVYYRITLAWAADVQPLCCQSHCHNNIVQGYMASTLVMYDMCVTDLP